MESNKFVAIAEKIPDDVMARVIEDYDAGVASKEIVEKYQLPIEARMLYRILPPKETGERCEMCGGSMLQRRVKAASIPYCSSCGHIKGGIGCICPNCKKKRAEELLEIQKEQEEKLKERRKEIDLKHVIPLRSYKTSDLDMWNVLCLGTFLWVNRNEIDGSVVRKSKPKTVEVAKELRSVQLIMVNVDYDIRYFDNKNEITNIMKVPMRINIDSEELDSVLQGYPEGEIGLNLSELYGLWREVVRLLLERYITFLLERKGYDFPETKTSRELMDILINNFSLGQSCQLLYGSMTKAIYMGETENHEPAYIANLAILFSKNGAERAIKNKYQVKDNYQRTLKYHPEVGPDIVEEYAINQVLKLGNRAFSEVPSKKILSEVLGEEDSP